MFSKIHFHMLKCFKGFQNIYKDVKAGCCVKYNRPVHIDITMLR